MEGSQDDRRDQEETRDEERLAAQGGEEHGAEPDPSGDEECGQDEEGGSGSNQREVAHPGETARRCVPGRSPLERRPWR